MARPATCLTRSSVASPARSAEAVAEYNAVICATSRRQQLELVSSGATAQEVRDHAPGQRPPKKRPAALSRLGGWRDQTPWSSSVTISVTSSPVAREGEAAQWKGAEFGSPSDLARARLCHFSVVSAGECPVARSFPRSRPELACRGVVVRAAHLSAEVGGLTADPVDAPAPAVVVAQELVG